MENSISLNALDSLRLSDEVSRILDLSGGKLNRFHVDISDGRFIPILGQNPQIVGDLRSEFGDKIHLESHLMVERPSDFIDEVADSSDVVFFHVESHEPDWMRIIDKIDGRCGIGVALFAGTTISAIDVLMNSNIIDAVNLMCEIPGETGEYHTLVQRKIEQLMDRYYDIPGVRLYADGHSELDSIYNWIDYEEAGFNVCVHKTVSDEFCKEIKDANTDEEGDI